MGKTTLAKALTKRLNDLGWPHVYQHLSVLPRAWEQEAVSNYARLCSPYVVRDRFHVSEPVYAQARGEYSMLTPETYRQVDRTISANNAFVVVITASPALLEQRYSQHEHREMYKLNQILSVNKAYQKMCEGEWNGYRPLVDLHYHCHEGLPFIEPDMIQLRAYTSRMTRIFHYPGGQEA